MVLGTSRIRWLGQMKPRPKGNLTFSMLNSAEHEIYPAHECYAIVGILTFISMIKTTSEQKNFFICQYSSFYEQLKFHAQLS